MKEKFFTGLIIVFPLCVTVWIFSFLLTLCTAPFISMMHSFFDSLNLLKNGLSIFSHDDVIYGISIFCIVLGILGVLFCIGIVSRWFFIRYMIHSFEKLLLTLPLINRVYKACKDFTNVIFSSRDSAFSSVVFAPFPTPEQKSLGLLTNEVVLTRRDGLEQKLFSILVPSTPNPTVGFLFLCSDVHKTDLPLNESIKWIVSCGSAEAKTILKNM